MRHRSSRSVMSPRRFAILEGMTDGGLVIEIVVTGQHHAPQRVYAALTDGQCAKLLLDGQILAEIDARGVVRRWTPTPPRNRGGHFRDDPGA